MNKKVSDTILMTCINPTMVRSDDFLDRIQTNPTSIHMPIFCTFTAKTKIPNLF